MGVLSSSICGCPIFIVYSLRGCPIFSDENEPKTTADINLGDIDFSKSDANAIARQRFKKVLSGIINVRTDGEDIYAARRVRAGYQWELYGPIRYFDS